MHIMRKERKYMLKFPVKSKYEKEKKQTLMLKLLMDFFSSEESMPM